MAEHTRTPWWIADAKGQILGPDALKVASTYTGDRTFEQIDADAAFICKAVNNHDALVEALMMARRRIDYLGAACVDPRHFEANDKTFLPKIDAVLDAVGKAGNPHG